MSVGAFSVIRFYERQQLEEQFNSTFSDKTTGLTQAIIAIEKILVATQQMMAIKPNISADEFAQLVNEPLLSGTSLKGVEWAPYVAIDNKTDFEQTIRHSGIFDFLIRQIDSDCISSSNELYPITYAEPSDHLGHELGLNLTTSCELQKNLALAANANTLVASQYRSDTGEAGVRLILPVKQGQKVQGYVLGLVMLNELVDSLWGALTQSADYRLAIFADKAQQQKLYDSSWMTGCEKEADCQQNIYEFNKDADIPFANQLLYLSFKQVNLTGKEDYYAYLAAFLVMLATVTLSYYLYNNINRMQWANRLVEERTASLKFQATHDQLTALLNKTSLFSYLEKFSKKEQNTKFQPFSILFIDLDHFKKINDTMGHLVGDQILQLVSQRIKGNSRSKDLLFRFGGDEFVIIVQGLAKEKQVVAVAERYLQELKVPYHVQGHSYQIGASIGASIIDVPGINAEDILRNADIAMYNAKESGRGQVVFFQPQMYDKVISQHRLEFDLAVAIEEDHFELHYQPIFDANHQLVGFEALARWQHVTKGLLMPLEFVPLLEHSNMIKPFGELVVKKAMAQLRTLYQFDPSHCPYISINISPLQLVDGDIVRQVEAGLSDYQVPANLIAIELTESALIENHEVVRKHLSALSRLGVRIYLDDFGTGYSSLSLLQHFPIDTLKIDRSFVSALSEETEAAENLIKAIIGMADALNMSVIAEGIEYRPIMSQLIEYGCNAFQGYYFAKPMAMDALRDFMQSQRRDAQKTTELNSRINKEILC